MGVGEEQHRHLHGLHWLDEVVEVEKETTGLCTVGLTNRCNQCKAWCDKACETGM